MKIITALSVLLVLTMTTGCQTLTQTQSETNTADTDKNLYSLLLKAKKRGCDHLTPVERSFIKLIILSQYPAYPKGGICEPGWLNTLLSNEIQKLDKPN